MTNINAITLCFDEAGVEQGFLKSRHDELRRTALLVFCLIGTYTVATLIAHWFTDWSTCGGVFIDSSEGRAIAKVRNLILSGMSVIAVIGIGVTVVNRVNGWLGLAGFEHCLLCFVCLYTLCITTQHPYVITKLMGESPGSVIVVAAFHTQDGLFFVLAVFATSWHSILPIRWIKIWLAELLAILVCFLGSLGPYAHNLGEAILNVALMCICVFAAAWGMRAREAQERMMFTQIAKEKVLRCEAEHALSATIRNMYRNESDTLSMPTTANTADVFDLYKGDDEDIDIRLAQINSLGLQEHWLINPEKLHLVQDRVLGEGGFGIAFVALYHGTEVVLKAARNSSSAKKLPAIANELRVLRRLHHPNLVTFYGACIGLENSEIVLVLEYIRGKQLKNAIVGIPTTEDAILERCILVENIRSALEYLHAQLPIVVHGDLTSSNVLVEQRGNRKNARLLDFGLSRLVTRRVDRLGGTLGWMAPEVFNKEQHATRPSADIFSFGYMLYMIMTGADPFSHVQKKDLVECARRGERLELQWPRENPLFDDLREICNACLTITAESRPSILQVHESLRGWTERLGVAVNAKLAWPFQQPSGSRHLWNFLQKAASKLSEEKRCSDAVEFVDEPSNQHESRLPMARRLLPHFDETPDHSRLMTILNAMSMWNLATDDNSCCPLHVLVADLQRLSNKLYSYRCGWLNYQTTWQCSGCKLVLYPGECDFCQGPTEGIAQTDGRTSTLRKLAL